MNTMHEIIVGSTTHHTAPTNYNGKLSEAQFGGQSKQTSKQALDFASFLEKRPQ